ncbi:TonB-dependent receptor [Novosphingobium pentaromativorans]|nr:TonB-dependent receptor [Novosphingobium pentaromativorans]AIT81499.1 hypothetical protein JI59_17830 [Novosphingobium pentaromativorans US6-1]
MNNLKVSARTRLLGACSLMTVGGMLGTPALAQDTQESASRPEAAKGIEEIIVTAQRREQKLQDVPVSVVAVSGAKLESRVLVDTTDIVKVSPDVNYFAGATLTGGTFAIRGLSSQPPGGGGFQQSAAFIADGVPLTRPGEFVTSLGDIDRVEILRGPQGTLIGKNATSGAISIYTKNPTHILEGEAEVNYTTDDEALVRAMVNLPVSEGIALRANGFYNHIDPLLKNNFPGGGDILGQEVYGGRLKALVEFSPDVQLVISGDYQNYSSTFFNFYVEKESSAVPGQFESVAGYTPKRGINPYNFNNPADDKAETYGVSAELSWQVSDDISITSLSAMRWFTSQSTAGEIDGTPLGIAPGYGGTLNPNYVGLQQVTVSDAQFTDVKYLTQELRMNAKTERFDIVGGIFYQALEDTGGNRQPFLFATNVAVLPAVPPAFLPSVAPLIGGSYVYDRPEVDFDIQDDTFAIFGDVSFKATDTLSVFGGLRYTHETQALTYNRNTAIGNNLLPGFETTPIVFADTVPAGSAPFNFGTINTDTGEVTGLIEVPQGFQQNRITNNVSGRIGIQFEPTPSQNYYFSYNTGYKGAAANVSRGSTADIAFVDPEKAKSFELGTKQQLFDNRVQLELNLYRLRVSNVQQYFIPAGEAAQQVVNAGTLKSDGIEFNMRALPFDNLTLSGSFAYNDARYGSDAPIIPCNVSDPSIRGSICTVTLGGKAFEPLSGTQAKLSYNWRYQLGATYTLPLETMPFHLTFDVNWNWLDEANLDLGRNPDLVEPSRGLLDASITVADDDDRWLVQIYGKNLTDKFYTSSRFTADNTIGRIISRIPRDYTTYGGIRVKYSF